MRCNICSEDNIEPDHEISAQHLRNKILFEYLLNRRQLTSNRKGAVVTCNVKSSFTSLADCADAKIRISAKPDEEVKFNFFISNENKKENMYINFIQIPYNQLNFIMNDHSVGFGCSPVLLKAKNLFPTKIYVQFKSSNIGQYELPIIFSFTKTGTDEKIVVMRDMVVYVEQKQLLHTKVTSPYAKKEVMAKTIIKTTITGRESEFMFRIPKNYKPVYASNLTEKENAPEHIKELTMEIMEVFSVGITRDNYVRFFHNLLWFEETIVRINLKKYNMSGVVLVQQSNECLGLFVPGLGEKRPSLLLGDLLYIKPQKTDEVMFEGVINDINENHIIINGLDRRFWKHYSAAARFDIRFFMSRLCFERMHSAVDNVLSTGQDARIFPRANGNVPNAAPIKNYYNILIQSNPEQRLAVERMVAGSCGRAPYLLHGPPGTGKTVTIVEAVLQLVAKNSRNRIMVCTDSNMAADHVATLLIKYKHLFPTDRLLLRANSKYRVWGTLPECLQRYSNGFSYHSFEPVSVNDFLSYRIIITTLSHAAKFARQFELKSMKRPISHLFVDEAAQASEPACLIPCVGLLEPRGALVLAGDPLQLGPVVISRGARERGLGMSLMERLKKTCSLYDEEKADPNYTVMLINNFRSHEDILHIPNNLFYRGMLKAYAIEDVISKADILGDQPESRAIVFHGILSKEQKMGKSPSYYNNMEMEVVQQYINCLLERHHVQPEDIGVVTPYIRQAYKIKTWLQKNNLGKLEVGTVEAFQGKEKRVIIISTVRANCNLLSHDAKFQLGFLVEDKRFNVALTRAKAKAIIIGNPLCLERDVKWRTLMEQCRRLGSYRGFDAAAAAARRTQQDLLDRIAPAIADQDGHA